MSEQSGAHRSAPTAHDAPARDVSGHDVAGGQLPQADGEADVRIAVVDAACAGELLTLRRAAYVTEAQALNDVFIAPLTQTLDELLEDLSRADVVTLGAWEGSRLVASIRIEIQEAKATLSRLAVAPDQQGRGIGTSLLFAMLPYLPQDVAEIWVFTSKNQHMDLSVYTNSGFEEQYDRASGELTYTYLRRVLNEAQARNI